VADWYDRAEVYDIAFDIDPARERAFLLEASERYGIARPRRILEPFCGSGRLLRALRETALTIGFDVNEHMVRYAAASGARVFRADAARFAVRRGSMDLAFSLIDSFRHLATEEAARSHLCAVAGALRPNGIYVIGFELKGHLPADVSVEEWTAERAGIRIDGRVRGLGDPDGDSRLETLEVRLDVTRRGAARERIEALFPMRTYTPREFEDLVDNEASFEIEAAFDHELDLTHPLELSEIEGSAAVILRTTSSHSAP